MATGMIATLSDRRVQPAGERCDQFDAVLDQLEAEGVRISGSSRFRFYARLLRAFAGSTIDVARDLEEDEAMRLGIACAEVGEMLETVKMLLRPPRVEGWLHKCQVAIGGHPIPVGGPDSARAAQFELVVAASCRKAGAEPIFEEPDVKVRVGQRTLYIAAKRLLSEGQFEKRTAQARDQIARAAAGDREAQGIIAYDLTPTLGFDRTVGRAADLHEVGRLFLETSERVRVAGRRIGERTAKVRCVRVAAAYARFCVVVVANKSFADVRPWYSGPVPEHGTMSAPLRKFLKKWGGLAPAAPT